MITDMYNNYSNQYLPYNYPTNFFLRNKSYLKPKSVMSMCWDVGETPLLSFNLNDLNRDNLNLSDGYTFILSFQNFRLEDIYSEDVDSSQLDQGILNLQVTKEITGLFTKGIYYCTIRAYKDDLVYTLLNPEQYQIQVK